MAWVAADVGDAAASPAFGGGSGVEQVLTKSLVDLRRGFAAITDELAARMPKPYIHLVQVLVDLLTATAPFALYPRGGAAAVGLSGVVALFFGGMLELSKALLDPFGNRNVSNRRFGADIRVDVLLGEINASLDAWPGRAALRPNSPPL